MPKGLHTALAQCHPKLSRGLVYCKTCKRVQKVNSAQCLATGWPKCCGETMTLDIPEDKLPKENQ